MEGREKRSDCLALSLDKPFFSPISLWISLYSIPNSILNEEAFQSLGLSDHTEFNLDVDNTIPKNLLSLSSGFLSLSMILSIKVVSLTFSPFRFRSPESISRWTSSVIL